MNWLKIELTTGKSIYGHQIVCVQICITEKTPRILRVGNNKMQSSMRNDSRLWRQMGFHSQFPISLFDHDYEININLFLHKSSVLAWDFFLEQLRKGRKQNCRVCVFVCSINGMILICRCFSFLRKVARLSDQSNIRN